MHYLHELTAASLRLLLTVGEHRKLIWPDPRIQDTDFSSLCALAAGPWSMSELARRQAITRQSMHRKIVEWERYGWVQRTRVGAQTICSLTEEGRSYCTELNLRIAMYAQQFERVCPCHETAKATALVLRLAGILESQFY